MEYIKNFTEYTNEKLDIKPVSKERLSDTIAQLNNEYTQLFNKWKTMDLRETIDIEHKLLAYDINDTKGRYVETFSYAKFKVEDKFKNYSYYKKDYVKFYEKHKKTANSRAAKPQSIIISLYVMLKQYLQDRSYYPIIELYLKRFEETYGVDNEAVADIFFKEHVNEKLGIQPVTKDRLQSAADNIPKQNDDDDATKIMFRREHYGEIVAIIDIWWNEANGEMTCYSHMSQHCGCTRDWVENETSQAYPKEYRDLLDELKGQGYDNLKIVDSLDDFTVCK